MKATLPALILLAAIISLAAQCNSGSEAKITVTEPYAQAAITGGNGAIYLKLMNEGGRTDTLLKVESQVAEAVEMHETTIDANDVMRMSPLAKIEVPAGESVSLEPGGKHIMLIKLNQDLKPGEKINLTLIFEKSGPVSITAAIREVGATEHTMDHGEHN